MNRTLTKKLIYVIAALTMLAMLIPAMAVPVSAAGEQLAMTVNGVPDGPVPGYPGEAFNVSGSVVTVTATNFTPTAWALENVTTVPGYQFPQWYPNGTPPSPTATSVQVQGVWGEARITASYATGNVSVTKKWGVIDHTDIGAPQTQYVTWNEVAKAFFASGNVTDLVVGDFLVNGGHIQMPAQNAILNWYLISAEKAIDMTPGLAVNLNTRFSNNTNYPKAQYTQFLNKAAIGYNQWVHEIAGTPPTAAPGWLGTYRTTVTGADGRSTVDIGAWFEENVQVVVVPQYPTDPNRFVTPEVTSINFATSEYEVVPQVRWAGEKIVLEANFGALPNKPNAAVEFYLQNYSVGNLESIISGESTSTTVWTTLGANGIASVIATSDIAGQMDVVAALYPDGERGPMTNQHAFRVYFLNFFSLTLRDVPGKRALHNAGDWTPSNPYSNVFPAVPTTDLLAQTANVSQDTLERAQVRGYFVPSGQYSSRRSTNVDLDADGSVLADQDMDDIVIGDGYYVLPDDWAFIGGYTGWQTKRPHWDIMDSPSDAITSVAPLGPYVGETSPTVGPFAPGIEVMTPTGWWAANPVTDTLRPYNTVVPNGALDAWDAPMPPAKVLFEITNGAGYFKDAYKTSIYYTGNVTKAYTEPFYQILIPAHESIPPFNNEFGGGYDWDSFDGTHGPYEFWKIINQPDAASSTVGDAMHPTRVEVYSDNHGEAMVYLNGDYNLDLRAFDKNGAADIQPGYVVGTTRLHASADYPYIRSEPAIYSNNVDKTWIWGGVVLGPDAIHQYKPDGQGQPALFYTMGVSRMVLSSGTFTNYTGTWPNEYAYSNKKAIFVWVSNRDGKIAGMVGTKVDWTVTPTIGAAAVISGASSLSLNNYNGVTQNIGMTNGFLYGTNGVLTGALDGHQGTSYMIDPNVAVQDPISHLWYNSILGPTDANGQTNAPYVGKTALQALFYKFYNPNMLTGINPATGLEYPQPANFAVAMIEVKDMSASAAGIFNVHISLTSPDFGLTGGGYGRISRANSGMVEYDTNARFDARDPIDDSVRYGDANLDGAVNMGDVTSIERMILGLTGANVSADANVSNSIDMGDVVKVERQILGY